MTRVVTVYARTAGTGVIDNEGAAG
jgi:hypothetical protein